MKYVYIVMAGCYGDYGIEGIYSSLKRAQDKVNEINSTHFGRTTKPFIEKWELNGKECLPQK